MFFIFHFGRNFDNEILADVIEFDSEYFIPFSFKFLIPLKISRE